MKKMKRIKILAFEIVDAIGGIETYLLTLAKTIDKQKYQIDIVTSYTNYVLKDDFLKAGCNVFVLPPASKNTLYKKAIVELIKANDYDFYYFNKNSLARTNAINTVYKNKKKQSKIIIHSHNTSPSKSNFLIRLAHYFNRGRAIKKADFLFACSEVASCWMFGKKIKSTIIPNGIIVDNFAFNLSKRNEIRDKYKIPSDSFVVGNVSVFKKQKNHPLLLKIFKSFHEMKPNSFLLLVGDGPDKDKIINLCKDYELMDCVVFCGAQKTVGDYLSAMDCFLLPSFYEGLPISIVEAQASGLTCFISNNITKQVQLTDLIRWISIDSSHDLLAEELHKVDVDTNKRYDYNQVVAMTRFSSNMLAHNFIKGIEDGQFIDS